MASSPTRRLPRLLEPARSIVSRFRAFARDPNTQECYAQEGEDLVLRRFLNDVAQGFYVDVGAHHPRRFSNTHLFYRAGWSGINLEPNPEAQDLGAKCRPRDINLQMGVDEQSGVLKYHRFDEPALNTFDA